MLALQLEQVNIAGSSSISTGTCASKAWHGLLLPPLPHQLLKEISSSPPPLNHSPSFPSPRPLALVIERER